MCSESRSTEYALHCLIFYQIRVKFVSFSIWKKSVVHALRSEESVRKFLKPVPDKSRENFLFCDLRKTPHGTTRISIVAMKMRPHKQTAGTFVEDSNQSHQ